MLDQLMQELLVDILHVSSSTASLLALDFEDNQTRHDAEATRRNENGIAIREAPISQTRPVKRKGTKKTGTSKLKAEGTNSSVIKSVLKKEKGLRASFMKRETISAFHFQHSIISFQIVEVKVGDLKQSMSRNWRTWCKQMRLINAKVDMMLLTRVLCNIQLGSSIAHERIKEVEEAREEDIKIVLRTEQDLRNHVETASSARRDQGTGNGARKQLGRDSELSRLALRSSEYCSPSVIEIRSTILSFDSFNQAPSPSRRTWRMSLPFQPIHHKSNTKRGIIKSCIPSLERPELELELAQMGPPRWCAPDPDRLLVALAREVARAWCLRFVRCSGATGEVAGMSLGRDGLFKPRPPLEDLGAAGRDEEFSRVCTPLFAFDAIGAPVEARYVAARDYGGAGERRGDDDEGGKGDALVFIMIGLCGCGWGWDGIYDPGVIVIVGRAWIRSGAGGKRIRPSLSSFGVKTSFGIPLGSYGDGGRSPWLLLLSLDSGGYRTNLVLIKSGEQCVDHNLNHPECFQRSAGDMLSPSIFYKCEIQRILEERVWRLLRRAASYIMEEEEIEERFRDE
ncbi:hypothetical protein B0H17DRAFT_1143175 [Mycena rosella]|uniref:Uncharacterized protein n=1 Tax=Mycena rosella TaxID=1033263 RepID=A0AAD7CVL6_MYCRO|nr:hypothetical protein B0H17DRAFT_1143175 [Mycena rosella]